MKAEACVGGDANAISWNVAEQHSAGGLAGADDSHAHAAPCVFRPLLVVGCDPPAVIVIDVDRLGAGRCSDQSKESAEENKADAGHNDSIFSANWRIGNCQRDLPVMPFDEHRLNR